MVATSGTNRPVRTGIVTISKLLVPLCVESATCSEHAVIYTL